MAAAEVPDVETPIHQTARFRAYADKAQGFGSTPHEALTALMTHLTGDPSVPIVIWPYNRGDAFFTDTQQERLRELKARSATLTASEREELERLVEAAFDATVARTQALQSMKP